MAQKSTIYNSYTNLRSNFTVGILGSNCSYCRDTNAKCRHLKNWPVKWPCGRNSIYLFEDHNLCVRGHTVLTINVPVVFIARYVMILRGATSLWGALEGVDPEKSRFSGPTPSNAQSNDVAPLEIITYRARKTTGALVVLCTRMLLCNVVVCCCV